MRRVLLHLGLHKTGTTAAQSFLYENRELIWPHFSLMLPYKTRKSGLSRAATHHSVYRLDSTLAEFGSLLREVLDRLDFGTRRGLILSEENFAGLRPSRNLAEGYAAAPDLAATLISMIRRRLIGEELDITVYLSLRQRHSWMRSLWSHDLQRTRIVQDFDEFCAKLDHLPSFDATVDRFRENLPSVSVRTAWLEDLQNRSFGPGTPFADFLHLPRDKASRLVPPAKANQSLPDSVLDELLALNRGAMDEATLIDTKKAIVAGARKELIGHT
ncbi:MAG: hypothetical protein AAGB28_10640 [Pseudomonadota bacterium]